jgi:hypothetical protein
MFLASNSREGESGCNQASDPASVQIMLGSSLSTLAAPLYVGLPYVRLTTASRSHFLQKIMQAPSAPDFRQQDHYSPYVQDKKNRKPVT